MKEISSGERKQPTPVYMNGVKLVDILLLAQKHKKLIFGLPLIMALVMTPISFIFPDIFKATTRVLPPQQGQSSAAALLSQIGGLAGAAVGATSLKNPNDLYVGMLRSRTIADNIIKQFDLKKFYGTESQEKARTLLADNTNIVSTKEGLITIDFEGKDKKLVANIANTYVAELMKLTNVLAVTEAAQRRLFFERQLETAKDNLARAEAKLKGSLDATGVISVDSESRAIVETVARLRAQVSAKEIQLNSLRAFVTEDNQSFKQVQEELGSARAELARLENGRPVANARGNVPSEQRGLESIKTLRDVKYYQMLYELLAKQYEAARLDEAKDSSVIQVLDPAVEPERKSRPSRANIILISALVSFLFGIAFAAFREARASLSQEELAKWTALKASFKRGSVKRNAP